MSFGAEKRSPFQLINDHIKSLEQDVKQIDELKKHLDKLLECAQADIFRKYDDLRSAINESQARTAKQLDEFYQQQTQKLDEARQKLIDKKRKAESELVVDQKPVEMPEVNLNCTVNIITASLAIGLLELSTESGRNTFLRRTLHTHELKTEPGSVGGFPFPLSSKSSDSGVTPSMIASCSGSSAVPSVVTPPSNEATRKRKKKEAATADTTKSPLQPSPPAPKITIHNLRDFVRCINCRKPRCVYTSKKLSRDDQECWNGLKGVLTYRCGGNIFPTQPLTVEQLTDCSKEVNNHYFSRERKFPAVCYNCGFDISISTSSGVGSALMHEDKQSDMIIHDVCQSCKFRGIKPRTRKKKPASKKAKTDK